MSKREIKFRYRYTNGVNWMFQSFTLDQIINGDPFEVISDNPLYKKWRMDGADEYIGIKDKLGVEIYENDIVDSENQPKPYPITVERFHGHQYFIGKNLFCRADAVYGTVIGNVFSNSKLLVDKI